MQDTSVIEGLSMPNKKKTSTRYINDMFRDHMEEIETVKDKVARLDHDSIVRIETVVNNMAVDLKALADGSAVRISALESKVLALEKVNDEVKPVALSVTVIEHDRQIRYFNTTLRNLNWFIGGSFMGFILLLGYFTRAFGLLK